MFLKKLLEEKKSLISISENFFHFSIKSLIFAFIGNEIKVTSERLMRKLETTPSSEI